MRMFSIYSLLLLLAGELAADEVQLSNGDLLNGKVLSLDDKQLVLKSDTLGEVKLAREKVLNIRLGDHQKFVPYTPASTPPTLYPAVPPASEHAVPRLKPSSSSNIPATAESSVQDVLNQLKKGANVAGGIKQIEGEFPLLAVPEVREYFDNTLKGLATGEMTVGKLRQQALDVRKQVKELEKELGPEGVDVLKPYMSILDKFIRESEQGK